MNNFNVDLSPQVEIPVFTPEELDELNQKYTELKGKVESGGELTLAEQRDVIRWFRANRVEKFILKTATTKVAKERKVKKLSRAKLEELAFKKLAGTSFTNEETLDYTYSIELYTGKKLTRKAYAMLIVKEAQQGRDALSDVEKLDKDYNDAFFI